MVSANEYSDERIAQIMANASKMSQSLQGTINRVEQVQENCSKVVEECKQTVNNCEKFEELLDKASTNLARQLGVPTGPMGFGSRSDRFAAINKYASQAQDKMRNQMKQGGAAMRR